MCGDLSPVSASSLKRRRPNVPADEFDKCALSQGLGEVDTHGQNNVYPCCPTVSRSVGVRTERRKAADKEAAIKLRLVEAELNSVRAKLETVNAEIAAMRFVSGEDLERALTCSICQDIMWKPVITPGCGHTFCRECLTNNFQSENATHARMRQGWNEIRLLPVHICPNCRVE
ncbi:hypothetical protein B0H14DRAFT_1156600 [Mycena olivaceomarginata]|nr:hypothetical protein B0H14DRAFT_1156600 [Mycena olivaceomarginata]